MQNYTLIFLIPTVFILAGSITYYAFPIVNNLALKYNFVDIPSERKQHNSPVARTGGLTIVIGFILPILIGLFFQPINKYFSTFNNEFVLIVIGSLLMFCLGLIDDIKGLSPWSRLIGQITIASILWAKGLAISEINFSSIGIDQFVIHLNTYIGYFFTIIWLVGVTNAFNWIDGLDGLAAGIAGITSLSFILIFHKLGIYEFIYLSAIICGACIGFLRNNFYPAKIFMGDGGAYFLGFSLASIAICDIGKTLNDPIFISTVIILLLPLSDMTLVIFKRLIQGKSPFHPDKNHLHHYLLNIGFNHKQTVVLLYYLSGLFAISGLILINFNSINANIQ